ncbi:MAG TPA: serine/threonine-protein kinase [Polyangium sp.]|nr:serine/threonine-protein kinase [Polyangium sp.]
MSTGVHQPGTLLMGKYRIERELGSGGMGVVLEATHVALGQTVAVKLLNAQHAQSAEVVARFLREARIAATLPSDHIARVSDVGTTEAGIPYIVMERLVGRDLDAELAQRGKLPVSEAVDLMLEACEGVAMAHAHGLVHRDLKPANLFLAERPLRPRVLKVLDFGLSKDDNNKQGALTGTETVFGTPQYMSPEQIQSARNVDALHMGARRPR